MKASRAPRLLALTCFLATVLSPPSLLSLPASSADALKWESLVAKKLKLPAPPVGAILCIGSSHMALWKTIQADLAPLHVHNFGIGGSKMVHAAELFVPRLVIPFKPRAVVLYEGSNDLASKATPEEVLEQFQKVHQQIHEALPETRLYVLGIVPSPGRRFERWDAIQQTNTLLKNEAKSHPWIKFLDTTTPLMGTKGLPRPECFIPNDVHMTELGYEAWKAVVAPALLAAELPFEVPEER
ncbi:MAG: Lysophospholipase L1 [Verrucomicrobia bacterium]|nr:MAG: Lysophospholipase L1 [Verrucomicrobiota bacterium]